MFLKLKKPTGRTYIAAIILVVFVFLYIHGAIKNAETVNTNMWTVDQHTYVLYAKYTYLRMHPYGIWGRNQMPAYPYIQSLFYKPNISLDEFFKKGKLINIFISLAAILLIFPIFLKYFSCHYSTNILLITAFTVFIFKAGYFQSEILFYFLNFSSFLLMSKLLVAPSWKWGILTGVVIGLAHLTKASILPGLAIFTFCCILKNVALTVRDFKKAENKFSLKSLAPRFAPILVVLLFFIIIIFPYIRNSKRVFGRYFYNVNSTFYIWFNNWHEIENSPLIQGNADMKGWPNVPPDKIPGLQKYFREHSMGQIYGRFANGMRGNLANCRNSYGFFKYVVIITLANFLLLFMNIRKFREQAGKYKYFVLFCLLYFMGYWFLYAWYYPIASGVRLMLAQLLPYIFTVSLIYRMQSPENREFRIFGKNINLATIINVPLTIMILIEIGFIMHSRILTTFGAE